MKTLKQQARKAEKIILEENKDFYNDFVAKNYPKKKRNLKPLMLISSALAATLAFVLFFVFILPLLRTPESDSGKQYLAENEKSMDSNLTELNLSLSGVKFEIGTGYECKIDRKYDAESNDTLCYAITLTNELETIDLIIYTNKDYKIQKQLTEDSKTVQIGDFSVDYDKSMVQDDIIFFFTYNAIIKYNDIEIFIKFEEISLGESNFFNFVEQTIIKI